MHLLILLLILLLHKRVNALDFRFEAKVICIHKTKVSCVHEYKGIYGCLRGLTFYSRIASLRTL